MYVLLRRESKRSDGAVRGDPLCLSTELPTDRPSPQLSVTQHTPVGGPWADRGPGSRRCELRYRSSRAGHPEP